MKNWKTSLFGILATVGLLIPSLVPNNPTAESVSKIITAVGALGTGLTAKDNNVTGGTKQQ